jgi:phosphatidyl-myo-inositol dimannoside synthase
VPAPRHIAFLSTDFKPMVGGVADHLHRLAEAMSEITPVTVMTSAPQMAAHSPRTYRLQMLPAAPQRHVGSIADRFAPTRKLRTGAYFLQLRAYGSRTISRLTADLGTDTAVVIGIWDMSAHAWCAACRRARVPYLLLAHGAEVLMPLHGVLPGRRADDFRLARHVIANSAATANLAAERLHLTMPPVVVHPSVGPRPDGTAIARRASELAAQLHLQNGRTIFSLGRLVPRKGFDLALRAVASLLQAHPGLSYVIAGDGPQRPVLESLARDLGIAARVHLLGRVDDLTKWAAFEACDLFLMPNRDLGGTDWEGFGIVFLEAALSSRPAIAGRTGGAADAVADHVTGLLVDPESQRALADAVATLLRDAELRRRFGQAGHARAVTEFTPASAAARLRVQVGWN